MWHARFKPSPRLKRFPEQLATSMNGLTLAAFISMLVLAFVALKWDYSRERS